MAYHSQSPKGAPDLQQNFVSPKPTIDELKQKAEDCETQAKQEPKPKASELREQAKLYGHWIALIRSGQWTA
jgi:hypothetical protein